MSTQRRISLLAALSFEERCVASLTEWGNSNSGTLSSATFFSYEDRATPDFDANVAREANWRGICKFADSRNIQISRCAIDPYSMGPLESHICAAAANVDEIVIDLSCFTKLHLMAVARAILKLQGDTTWTICYSSPFSYGNLNAPASRGGWQDTLVLPLGDDPSLTNQGMALGLLLAGMEADRTAIAMSELEPASGLILLSRSEGRPDLQRLTRANNELLFEHLRGLRMPGPLGKKILPYFPSGGWEIERIRTEDVIRDVTRCLGRVVTAAHAIRAPVILFPFGPKIVTFLASLYLARHYSGASWAIYPVPKTHPLDYSDGVRSIAWYKDSAISSIFDGSRRASALSV
jgi:hypothetical protein